MKKKATKPKDIVKKSKGIGGLIKDVDDYDPEVKIVLYGPPGTGKTTLAGTFPKALLVDISEKGTDSVRDVKGLKVIRITEWDQFEELFWYLEENKDGFETVIIDTVSFAQELCLKDLMGSRKLKGDKKLGDWGTMTKRDWGKVAGQMKEMISNFRDLEMNVVFIAHDRVFNAGDEDDEGDDRVAPTVGPRLMPSVTSVLNGAVGIIGQAFIREKVKVTKDEKTGKKKEKRSMQYCLRVGPHSYFTTKVRKPRSVDLPDILIDPDYSDIMELFGELKD